MSGLPNMNRTHARPETLAPNAVDVSESGAVTVPEIVPSGNGIPFTRKNAAIPISGHVVLLALSEDEYRKSLAEDLRRQGFVVHDVATAQAAIAFVVSGEKFHVIVVADDLPDLTGLETLSRLRDLRVRTPVALLAEVHSESREEVALGCGAADFICRSRRSSIIARRLCLLADGAKLPMDDKCRDDRDLKLGGLVLKSGFHRAIWRGREVPLTVTEVRIVRLLACQAGTALAYRAIYDVVHGAGFVAGEGPNGYRINVRSLIRKIRKRFRAIDSSFDQIENYQGFGYRWRDKPGSDNDGGASA